MPFAGQLITQGDIEVASSSAETFQTLTVANGATGNTRNLRIVGMSKVTVLIEQTAGAVGTSFRLQVRDAGTRTIDYPASPIPALNSPTAVTYNVAARGCRVQLVAPGAGGPHTYNVEIAATSTGGGA
jgi:hypothetical protein